MIKLQLMLKRLIDILGSLIGIIVLSPVYVIVGILVYLKLGSPILFSQMRPGKDEKIFKMYKFRSMLDSTNNLGEVLPDEERLTPFGARLRSTSLDELPELFNVLKGEMSLVGPRPSLPEEVEKFEPWMLARLGVKPGLTCYWQVSGRNDIEFEEWMKLDIKYAKERSIFVDLKLIIKTFFVLFGDEHAC